jgi:predicted ATPase/DNA-binding SARP family transcriptional activator
MARLFLFGSPSVDDDGETLALPFERRNQVLVFLALKGAWVGRAELAAMLWPEQETKLAYTNLRKTLFRLQSFAWARAIEVQGSALRFEVETDVAAFESALREERVADALALRRGELLVGFDDDHSEAWSSWLAFERDRLRLAWRDAALDRLAADIDPAEGIDLSTRLLDADPLDEAALRAQMSWLARGGQSARARQAYREFVGRLAKDLGLSPGAELKALHDALGTPVSAVKAPITTPAARPEDGFVGRTVELRRIATLLTQEDCRLLCLIGPGGVGKTRLAQRALEELAPHFVDGSAFVPLEDLSSASEVGGRIAREAGAALAGSQEPLDQVIAFLRDRHMLLVFDNFEHLAAHASIVQKLLDASPQVRIIVTSRVRLALSSEWLFPLEGLPCPEIEDRDRVEAFDAVRLFVAAAQRVEPALVPAVEAAAIVDICRQVEGMPLALELAAAWTRVLSCDAIAAELRQGTELLRAVDPAHPPRHASIEVVFEQSWRLLSVVERDALARLSVFRGGFSADAARAIAAASLPVLRALADKSLLRKEEARIFMHPLVAQLAALRLGDGGAREPTEDAHALYFNRLLAQLRRAVGDGDREALERVDTEFENCRIAWRRSIAHGAGDALRNSTLTLLHFCDHRGRFDEGLSLLRAAIESPPVRADPKLEALLLAAASHLEYRLDRYADAEATATRVLAASRATLDHDTRLQCLKVLGACCLRLGRHDEARRYFKQALQQAPASTDPHNAAAMLDNLALVENAMGRRAEALRLSMQSLLAYERLGDVAGAALCRNNLGMLHMDKGELESADMHLKAGLALCDHHGLVNTRGLILANLTELALKTGAYDAAETYARKALASAESTANRAVESWLRLQFVRLALRRADFTAARSDLATALSIAISVGRPSLRIAGITCFAEILEAQGEADCARRVLAFAAGHPSTNAAERADIRARLAHSRPVANAEPAWPGLELDDLVHRIVIESSVAHAPLLELLRGER